MNITLKPNVLKWARTRAGLDQSMVAKKVLGSPDRVNVVAEWERTGEITVTPRF